MSDVFVQMLWVKRPLGRDVSKDTSSVINNNEFICVPTDFFASFLTFPCNYARHLQYSSIQYLISECLKLVVLSEHIYNKNTVHEHENKNIQGF